MICIYAVTTVHISLKRPCLPTQINHAAGSTAVIGVGRALAAAVVDWIGETGERWGNVEGRMVKSVNEILTVLDRRTQALLYFLLGIHISCDNTRSASPGQTLVANQNLIPNTDLTAPPIHSKTGSDCLSHHQLSCIYEQIPEGCMTLGRS
ncbi:hypothetical protein BCR34DRAFT_234965 [Clohesyomyces aquaticus]|uniref:Uncharacterized protein n=1 Tax=Clohesyomyces aquaticus TaxID=1231657 RepID=A0A1Y1Y6V9_9PLEO|nr:hypothetical protein BCR34DRAFT_234965 [Clohesyomyces aquaticus]